MKDVKYVCENCGSDDVESLAWVKENTKEYVKDAVMESWCPICDMEVNLVLKGDFKILDDVNEE